MDRMDDARSSGDPQVDADAALEREPGRHLRALLVLEEADHRLAEAGSRRARRSPGLVVRARRDHGARAGSEVLTLEDAEPTKTPSQPSSMRRPTSAGVARPPAAKVTTGSRPARRTC